MSRALYPILRRLLFRIDPERAHELAIAVLRAAEPLARRRDHVRSVPERKIADPLGQELLGLWFPSPLGLAAGLDKNAVAPHVWGFLGFGFAELGTVTALAQPGNPRPRLFRLEAERAIVNRLGFNSSGAAAVAARLRDVLRQRPSIPIGINLGCSRSAIGDPARELADYDASTRQLAALADYLAINVSSPNTPGLRDLQVPARLGRLVATIREAAGATPAARRILVKLAPDLHDASIQEIVAAAIESGTAGFIAGNTTLARPGCSSRAAAEAGGLSGAPLRRRATELVAAVRAAAGDAPVVVGVGGVATAGDVIEKLSAGADLVALYTALIYEGPFLARTITRQLANDLAREGSSLLELGRRRARAAPHSAAAPA